MATAKKVTVGVIVMALFTRTLVSDGCSRTTTCPGWTNALRPVEDADPGLGLTTATGYVPGVFAVMTAINCVPERKVVGTAAPFHRIWAP